MFVSHVGLSLQIILRIHKLINIKDRLHVKCGTFQFTV